MCERMCIHLGNWETETNEMRLVTLQFQNPYTDNRLSNAHFYGSVSELKSSKSDLFTTERNRTQTLSICLLFIGLVF